MIQKANRPRHVGFGPIEKKRTASSRRDARLERRERFGDEPMEVTRARCVAVSGLKSRSRGVRDTRDVPRR
jgi:hypothetical protein